MVREVVLHEGADEVVAVVVAFMATQLQGLSGGQAGGLQQVRVQLIGQELV